MVRGWLVALGAASVVGAQIVGAQVGEAQAASPEPSTASDSVVAQHRPTAPVHGRLLAATAPVRSGGAYLWVDTPELRTLLSTACTAARANEPSWVGARTELAAPTGEVLDSVASIDLATLRALADQPHAVAPVDSIGRFVFDSVPAGDYWVEAESMDGATIAQWWRHVSYAPTDIAVARLMRGRTKDDPLAADLNARDAVRGEFCVDSSARAGGSAVVGNGASYRIVPNGPNAGRDTPPMPIGPLPLPEFPESIIGRHVETKVVASFMVRADGTVDPTTISISGGANSDVTGAVRGAIAKWRFEPARRDGEAVAGEEKIEFGLGIGPG